MAIWTEVNVGKYNAGSAKAGGSWVRTPLGASEFFLFAKMSRLALGPTQTPV